MFRVKSIILVLQIVASVVHSQPAEKKKMSSFEGAGQAEGLEIWRIEDFEAVPYDKASYGKFYSGDSYIVLKTSKLGSRLTWDLHFWLGTETSQDESGTAAIKSVELDDSLSGGAAVQHREVQEHESSLFQSYFKNGVRYLPGGVKSGFTHVDPEAVEKRLFQVKGQRNIKVKQIALDASLMNQEDCFILDLGKGHDILVYMPAGARRMEKFRATTAANEIRDEDHAGDAKVVIIDEFGGGQDRFFEELGSGSADSIPKTDSVADADAEAGANRDIKLYKVSGTGSDIEVTEVGTKPLKHGLLKQEDCFILDTGSTSGIFAWIGKEASQEERVQAMKTAETFLERNGLPKWTKVERVVDGGETAMFKQYFSSWKENDDSPYAGLGRVYPAETVAEWDVGALHSENRRRLARSAGAAVGFMPDDSTGTKEIFRIEDMAMVPLDESAYGLFFGGDSYVIKYSYEKEGRAGYIVYFWQGSESTQDEKAASALSAVQLDDELFGKATQVRVVQGREPRHFIKMFGGKMIVFSGGKASGFKNVHDHDTYDVDGTRMFRVRGISGDDVRAVQVAEVAASLNSEDVFILETPKNTWIWTGEGSNEDEQELAVGISSLVSPDRSAEKIAEGSEPEEFWSSIGGKGDYSKEIDLDKPILEPRLFHCKTMPSGKVRMIEINSFEQDDLVADDVMILDSGDEIYVWVGKDADEAERKEAMTMAKQYIAKDPTDRDEKNTLVFAVKQGEEPSSFTCVFPAFNA
jgi:gelsolin